MCIYFIKDIFANIIETFICKIRATSLMDNPVYDYSYTYLCFFFIWNNIKTFGEKKIYERLSENKIHL